MKFLIIATILLVAITACTIIEQPDNRMERQGDFNGSDMRVRPNFNNSNISQPPQVEEITTETINTFSSEDENSIKSYCEINMQQCITYCMQNKENSFCNNIVRRKE
ncbi:hypothetical protein JXM83_02390 [Candidatus Woesearchaeota archaeon]|nr:hypothetical protein [Candidatus Woesearchaeota archaeon]